MRYASIMWDRIAATLIFFITLQLAGHSASAAPDASSPRVYVLPIRDNVMPPLVYLVRRGVKEAMQAKAETLVLDMDTNGGRVDTTEEIIQILDQFKGHTVTYVDQKAFSAGSFIAFATQKIYMAPQSVIGAAAPIMLVPGGGPAEMPQTVEAKMTSGIRALVRTRAEKNGYNVKVVESMIDRTRELKIGDEVLNEKGQILTLTNIQAEKEYGNPPKPLLSSGTVESLSELISNLGYSESQRIDVVPTGVERLASWINTISPLLLIIGVIGLYIEFKTPGFGLPGIVGLTAFAVYFFGGYIAGLSGMEWVALFFIGILLVAVELLVFPGTILLGLSGAALMLLAIIMAMVDVYPTVPGVPLTMQFRVPLLEIVSNLSAALLGSAALIWLLSRILPKTALYGALVSGSASGEASVVYREMHQAKKLGAVGITISALRPGGRAQFGEEIADVISQGELIPKDRKVKIVGYSGIEAIVESVNEKSD